MMPSQLCDIAIIGGGIAALWTFAMLKQQGFSVVLIEKNELGGGQTGFSQGILHAGVKYSLSGEVTQAAHAANQAISLWKQALQGKGCVDLSSALPSSHAHCLVIKGGFQAQFKAMMTTQLVSSQCRKLSKKEYPSFFQHQEFQGAVCELDETVLDTPQVIHLFSQQFSEYFLKADDLKLIRQASGRIEAIEIQTGSEQLRLQPQWTILAAGEGNEGLLQGCLNPPLMQVRPLHMVAVQHPDLHPLWVHVLEKGSTPSMTITTHGQHAQPFWYLGGEIAESGGVARNEKEQIAAARTELERHFPWLDLEGAAWRLIRINRAEGRMPGGKRPDASIIDISHNSIVCWPTKLVLAPVMALTIVERLLGLGVIPAPASLEKVKDWKKPPVSMGIQGVF